MFESITPLGAFGFGALLVVIVPKQWIFVLGAINSIRQGELSQAEGIVAYLIYAVGASALVPAPILLGLRLPDRRRRHRRAVGSGLSEITARS